MMKKKNKDISQLPWKHISCGNVYLQNDTEKSEINLIVADMDHYKEKMTFDPHTFQQLFNAVYELKIILDQAEDEMEDAPLEVRPA